jgi:hypothetical protein
MHGVRRIWRNGWNQGFQPFPLRIGEIGRIGNAVEYHWQAVLASFHLFYSLCDKLLSLFYRQDDGNQTLSKRFGAKDRFFILADQSQLQANKEFQKIQQGYTCIERFSRNI